MIRPGIYRDASRNRVDVISVATDEHGHAVIVYREINDTRRLRTMSLATFTEVLGVGERGKDVRRFEMVISNAEGPK